MDGHRLFKKLLPLLNFEMQTVDLVVAFHKRVLRQLDVIACKHGRDPAIRLDAIQEAELEHNAHNLSALRK